MRIRRDSAFVASVLFTVALLCLIPWSWRDALAYREARMENLDAGWQVAMHATSKLGVASLAIILVGLTTTWWGYINRVRWAWFVMFIIAWCWAFPLLVLPLLTHQISYTLVQLLYSAMHQRGFARVSTQSIAIFSLLAIALVLPIKSFFFVTPRKEPISQSIDYAQGRLRVGHSGRCSWTLGVDKLSLL